MKKVALILFCMSLGLSTFAQSGTSEVKFPEYINKGTIPEFSLVVAPDSSTFTNKNLKKNKPLLVMIFSPECGHCQHETRVIEKNMDHFKNVQILMVTWLPYNTLVPFSKTYETEKYPNMTLAHDPNDFFYGFYQVQKYPKVIVYNKNGDYVSDYAGTFDIENVWKDLGVK